MSHNPAKEPCSEEYHNPECCYICGPSGNKNLINQNEKGIIEHAVHSVPMEVSERAVAHQKWNI